jgi:hypothetical protein
MTRPALTPWGEVLPKKQNGPKLEPLETRFWRKVDKAGREWHCRAASSNAYALIDYDAGYNAGRAEKPE